MKTRSILVRFPGLPLDPMALLPDRHLASLAACLLDADHWTQVWDYTTVETLDKIFTARYRTKAHRYFDRIEDSALFDSAPPRGLGRMSEDAWRQVAATAAEALGAVSGLHFVLFSIHRGCELRGVREIALRLREQRPGLRLLGAGEWIDVYGQTLAASGGANFLDGLCVGDAETVLTELADRMDRPESWALIPNLIPLALGRRDVTTRRIERNPDLFPKPVYMPEVYPALHGATQFRLFTLDDGRGCTQSCHACPQPALSDGEARLHSVRSVCDEMARLGRMQGARTFRFSGVGAPEFHASAIGQGILARRMAVSYSRPLQLSFAGPGVAQVLRASGCIACSARMDTGSQRMLDDYYAREIGVSRVEEVLKACVHENLFTVVKFIYPCPVDDYHSEAETLRIVDRVRPHAAEIGLPMLSPHSDWHAWPGEFGFSVHPKRYLEWVAQGCQPEDALPYRVGNRTPKKTVLENAALRKVVERCGVSSRLCADLALIARISGYAGREQEFASALRRQLLTGDTENLAAMALQFNQRACVPPNTIVYTPFEPVLAAVGN